MSTIITLRWTLYCHRCGHGWAEEQRVERTVTYAAPSFPTSCEECGGNLSDSTHARGRTFTVSEVGTFD